MQQQPKPIQTIFIAGVEIHYLYPTISQLIGYTPDQIHSYRSDIIDLLQLWTNQGFIEVYEDDADRGYGRAKDTASVPGSVPWYYGMYHARVLKNSNDPLIVVVFEEQLEDGETVTIASIRFLATHDDLFGVKGGKVKSNKAQMDSLRRQIDEYIQMGNRYNAQQNNQS